MTTKNRGLIIGAAIILIGLFALLVNLRIIHNADDLIEAGVFLSLAFVFLYVYRQSQDRTWALICAIFFILISLGFIIRIFWDFPNNLIGAAYLWGGTALFAQAYAKDAKNWWAIIPAGILFTLGSVVIINTYDWLSDKNTGVVLLLGFGLTFAYLWTQRNAGSRLDWAKYPAMTLILLALFIYAENVRWLRVNADMLWPLALVLLGGYLILRARKNKQNQQGPWKTID
jgi:hypothetical protein